MHKTCERCGTSVPFFEPRQRVAGLKVCATCAAADVPSGVLDHVAEPEWDTSTYSDLCLICGWPVTRGSEGWTHDKKNPAEWADYRKQASLQTVAHDSGDGETVYHCPFCGSGNVTARSDQSAECGFCTTVFTVQVQPTHPYTPQTIDGKPYDNPDMPGQVTDPSMGPGELPAEDAGDNSLTFNPEGAPTFDPPAQPEQLDQPELEPVAASKTALKWVERPGPDLRSPTVSLASSEAPYHALVRRGNGGWHWELRYQDYATMQESEGITSGVADTKPEAKAAVQQAIKAHKATSKSAAYFLNSTGDVLAKEAMVKHLALVHADDRQATLKQVRSSNVGG